MLHTQKVQLLCYRLAATLAGLDQAPLPAQKAKKESLTTYKPKLRWAGYRLKHLLHNPAGGHGVTGMHICLTDDAVSTNRQNI